MLSRIRNASHLRTLRRFRTCSYSTTTEVPPKPKSKAIWESFDKTMYYPAILLILFGSQIINVMNSQRDVEDMERRYVLKMDKLEELKTRVLKGEKDVDVHKELELINKMFQRSEKGGGRIRFDGYTIPERGNHEGLIEEFDDKKLNELFGLTEEFKEELLKEDTKIQNTRPDTAVLNSELIREQVVNEKELVKYKLNPELHVIVENPGDYNDSAKDTKVTTFL